jgi:hypothetical protein
MPKHGDLLNGHHLQRKRTARFILAQAAVSITGESLGHAVYFS